MDIINRFLKYVSFETTSIEDSLTRPSNPKELKLFSYLEEELKSMGLSPIYKDGFIYTKIKSDCGKKDSIFLMAHTDTSPDASGANIKPRIVKFSGEDIILNKSRKLSIDSFSSLKKSIGHDLIVTDGTTLLGADDKAGIAIIMDTVEKILKRGGYPNIIICFSADEEIGMGTHGVDIEYIKNGESRIYAYTIDGGDINEFSYENFNAQQAKVKIIGTSIHPSIGKNKLINAQEVFIKFHNLLPLCKPENTEKREGFIHLCNTVGSVEEFNASYILRSFSLDELNSYNDSFNKAKDEINKLYGKDIVSVNIKDQYRNMVEVINNNKYVIDIVSDVYKDLGIDLIVDPIRGGTDGATLSHKGLPCPNLGTGGYNFHGVYEYLDIDQMKMMVNIITKLMDKIN